MEALMQSTSNDAGLNERGQQSLVQLLLEEHPDSPWTDRRLSELLAG